MAPGIKGEVAGGILGSQKDMVAVIVIAKASQSLRHGPCESWGQSTNVVK